MINSFNVLDVMIYCKTITVSTYKQTTSKNFQTFLYYIYLCKLYDILIAMLLTNDLTNICNEISNIQLILGMAYTCNVKGFEEFEKISRN